MTTPESLTNTHSKSLINLLRGWPSTTLLPTQALSDAAQSVLADTSVAYPGLLYGPDEGHPPLRNTIAQWLTEFYKPSEAITKERIAITGGASQNLGGILQVFTDPLYTRNVWIVAPAYMLAFRVFVDNGFSGKMQAVPEDEEGIDIEFLRREIEESEKKAQEHGNTEATTKPARPYAKYYKHIIYCVPTFANPSSRTMSLERRRSLVQLARDFDALVVSDDVYDFLQWTSTISPAANEEFRTSAILPRLVDIDRTLSPAPAATDFGNTLSNGSFSKILAPGVRVGWAEGSAALAYGVSQLGTTCSGGAPSQLTSTYVERLLKQGVLDRHIRTRLQPAYASRWRCLVGNVERVLGPLGVKGPQSDREIVGGFFVWYTLPEGVLAEEFVKRCREEENVVVAPGSVFEVPGDDSISFERDMRLCFSWEDEDKMVEAVGRMRAVLEKMLKGEKQTANMNDGEMKHFW
ncbi:Valine--pyruvate aminotransferase [Zalaria obscura]|uniref:Valine--pyruvate aminotransferase n=1 Tax=Zalaria obscura TaxID=2024903 RepID=A0ACC3S3C3_9PEZI